MATKVSVLDLRPRQLIREVSPKALKFYIDGLNGLYLPEDFVAAHSDELGVRSWSVEQRLGGKFGRFTIKNAEDKPTAEADILLIGTTIGLGTLNDFGFFSRLGHYELAAAASTILSERGLDLEECRPVAADYGETDIVLHNEGSVSAVHVLGRSLDFGRAGAAGRTVTCKLFEKLLGDEVKVINDNPYPRADQLLIEA